MWCKNNTNARDAQLVGCAIPEQDLLELKAIGCGLLYTVVLIVARYITGKWEM